MNSTAKKVKKLMIDVGVTGAEIARMAGVDRSAIAHIIAGRSKSPRLRILTARVLGVRVKDIWPEEKRAETCGKSTRKAWRTQ